MLRRPLSLRVYPSRLESGRACTPLLGNTCARPRSRDRSLFVVCAGYDDVRRSLVMCPALRVAWWRCCGRSFRQFLQRSALRAASGGLFLLFREGPYAFHGPWRGSCPLPCGCGSNRAPRPPARRERPNMVIEPTFRGTRGGHASFSRIRFQRRRRAPTFSPSSVLIIS